MKWYSWIRKPILFNHLFQFNTLRPRQNGCLFADDIFKRFFFNENVWISIKLSLTFVPRSPINNIASLVEIMAWRRSGDKPLSELMMVSLLTHICVTRPQWVKAKCHSIVLLKMLWKGLSRVLINAISVINAWSPIRIFSGVGELWFCKVRCHLLAVCWYPWFGLIFIIVQSKSWNCVGQPLYAFNAFQVILQRTMPINQNGSFWNFDFKLKFGTGSRSQSIPKTTRISTRVFCTLGLNFVILALTGDKLSHEQTGNWRTHTQTHT